MCVGFPTPDRKSSIPFTSSGGSGQPLPTTIIILTYLFFKPRNVFIGHQILCLISFFHTYSLPPTHRISNPKDPPYGEPMTKRADYISTNLYALY